MHAARLPLKLPLMAQGQGPSWYELQMELRSNMRKDSFGHMLLRYSSVPWSISIL
jgi:hypothetical protein